MEKKDKNKKLAILVATLLLVIGVSFAYWTGVSDTKGNGEVAEGNITIVKGAELNVQGTLEFNDMGILPGHKNVSSVKVTATGNNELIPYNLIWNGTNNLNTPLNFTVYKTSTEVEVTASCQKQNKVENGLTYLSEECTISNLEELGSNVAEGTIDTSETKTKVTLVKDEFIAAVSNGQVVYYYIILEYPNLDSDQNIDMGKSFDGVISAEESNAVPDITIAGVYIKKFNESSYNASNDIPQSGYILNKEKSTCSNNAIPEWKDGKLEISGYTKQGTKCDLYFDEKPTGDITIAKLNLVQNKGTPNFFKTSCSSGCDETTVGIYKMQDDDGDSYYFRGNVENNYLKFANFWWRIIRINVDGTIRIIYDGTEYHANGTSTRNSVITSAIFNLNSNDNAYLGFMYGATGGSNYSKTHENINKSNIMEVLETWYRNNLVSYTNSIDTNAGFCGDRTSTTDYTGSMNGGGGTGTILTVFGAKFRLDSTGPILKCPQVNDLYTVKTATKGNKALSYPIGLITADEATAAGGKWGINSKFYLYNGYKFWTMSPYWFGDNWAGMHLLYEDGGVRCNYGSSSGSGKVSYAYDVRPVINLRADVSITGSGTANDPFVVS